MSAPVAVRLALLAVRWGIDPIAMMRMTVSDFAALVAAKKRKALA